MLQGQFLNVEHKYTSQSEETQTDKEYLLWNRSAANSLRISSTLVDLLLKELDNISAELPLLKVMNVLFGKMILERNKKGIFLQLLREIELPKVYYF
ncbi:unnamed protein product [Meloidogyne enterolobii]|uniref:Uncharacterized protein n=1 Tax=Meloidogyne enterolobii TaxID=390850 RepID=A0ACB0YQD5_MELEN